jgi:hypothetical protein
MKQAKSTQVTRKLMSRMIASNHDDITSCVSGLQREPVQELKSLILGYLAETITKTDGDKRVIIR